MRKFDNVVSTRESRVSVSADERKLMFQAGAGVWLLLFLLYAGLTAHNEVGTFKEQLFGAIAFASAGTLSVMLAGAVVVHRSGLLMTVERVMNVDINRDGQIGNTNLLIQTDENQWRLGQYNVPPDLLIDWAKSATATPPRSLAYNRWEKRWPNGQAGYAEFRDRLVEQGRLAVTRGKQVQLTIEGRNFFQQIASLDAEQIAPPYRGDVPQLPPYTAIHD